jgi:hypothetical protein
LVLGDLLAASLSDSLAEFAWISGFVVQALAWIVLGSKVLSSTSGLMSLSSYGEIGIVPIIYAINASCEPFGPPSSQAYQDREWPWRTLLDANPGLPIAWHGDDLFFGLNRPLDDLYGFVTRNDVANDGTVCPGYAWLKPNALTVEEALPMMTINAVYALFRDDEISRLELGKYADINLLSGNPLAIDAEQIPELDVWMTMIGGRVAYCEDGHLALCP